ncbi:hypothetical protein EXN66_Car021360 [Channa argus]|uniref:Uncharacterized protein n=1 Tax=Channa argus TaxID=215402 RepID=A0A6G1QTM5_CHAAH|nr:hypothetical protein EXN66_Car021360 [Channa argus]
MGSLVFSFGQGHVRPEKKDRKHAATEQRSTSFHATTNKQTNSKGQQQQTER